MDRNSDDIQKVLSVLSKIIFTFMAIVIMYGCFAIEATKRPAEEIDKIIEAQKKAFQIMASGETYVNKNLPNPWPPRMNKQYPNIRLIDQAGKEFSLKDHKGKILVIEYVDMSSPKSQAQSGAHLSGAYGKPSQEIDKSTVPFSEVLRKNTNKKLLLPHKDIMVVKIIVYGPNGEIPTKDNAQNWAGHFHLTLAEGNIVAVPEKDLRGEIGSELISGYQLVDKNFMLRVDSSGAMPKHNLEMTFIPLVSKLLQQ